MEKKPAKLLILYATETGNALDAAERIGREAERRGCAVSVLSIDDFDSSTLPYEDTVIFVVSTTGQGDTPDSMKAFWKFLLQKNMAKNFLEGVRYAVFGLGDSGYQKYNFVAKKLDRRLSDLGAVAVVERGLGDDQHPSGYEGALDPWMSSLWNMLYQINPKFFPNGPDFVIPDKIVIDQPKFQITYHETGKADLQSSTASGLACVQMQIGRARSMSAGKFSHDKNIPDCFLKIIKNQPLSRAGCGKDVRHFEFEFVSSKIEYEVGDVCEVLPGQDPAAVDAFIQRCNLDPESRIIVHPRGESHHLDAESKDSKVPIKLKTFVELTMDVASASPRQYFFEVMSFFATAEHEKERLQYFASPEGRHDLYQYNQKERRTVLEVLEDFPSVQMPFEWLVQLVPPLKTRAFSISSSPSAHPNEVHLTVNVVLWTTPFKRKRTGLCSMWLAGLDPQEVMERCFKKKSKVEASLEGEKGGCNSVKRSHFEFELANLLVDPGLRRPITEYDPNIRDEIRRAYLQKGPCQPRGLGHNFQQTLQARAVLSTGLRWSFVLLVAVPSLSSSHGSLWFVLDGLVMSFFATAEHEKERLQYFASPDGRDDLYQYNQKERRTVLEVLEDFPSVQMPFEWLVQLVPPLKIRAFSISSSPSAHPNEVHLTVNVVLWTNPFKRKRTGLCSMWLAGLDPQEGIYIPAWFHKGSLPPPPPSFPLVLVGPGTGCAPFRGFVEERAMRDVSGSAAPIMMFFGCRNEENDFLYRDFRLSHAQNGGLLSIARGGGFYVAFSRDQPQKVYVQHKMLEQSQRVWDLVLEGASIYVAGSSTKMPSDVMSALEEIISKEAGVSTETAVLQLRRLEKDGRYHVEAWP